MIVSISNHSADILLWNSFLSDSVFQSTMLIQIDGHEVGNFFDGIILS